MFPRAAAARDAGPGTFKGQIKVICCLLGNAVSEHVPAVFIAPGRHREHGELAGASGRVKRSVQARGSGCGLKACPERSGGARSRPRVLSALPSCAWIHAERGDMDVVANSKAPQGCSAGLEGGAAFTGISAQGWTGPLLSQGQRAALCSAHRGELAGIEVFKYPSMLWTRLSRGGGSMPFGVVPSCHPCKVRPSKTHRQSPLQREREGTVGSTCPRHAEVVLLVPSEKRRVKAVVELCLQAVCGS